MSEFAMNFAETWAGGPFKGALQPLERREFLPLRVDWAASEARIAATQSQSSWIPSAVKAPPIQTTSGASGAGFGIAASILARNLSPSS